MTTTHNATQTEQQPKPTQPAVPAYLGELLARAADLFSARWPEVFVEFPWWEEGREIRYTARMEWRFSMKGPRVSVFDGRSGLFVCQSLEGLPYEIDPEAWSIDVPEDEIAMHAWEQRRKHKGPDGRH
jgi:hypothetical protein